MLNLNIEDNCVKNVDLIYKIISVNHYILATSYIRVY